MEVVSTSKQPQDILPSQEGLCCVDLASDLFSSLSVTGVIHQTEGGATGSLH